MFSGSIQPCYYALWNDMFHLNIYIYMSTDIDLNVKVEMFTDEMASDTSWYQVWII